MNVTNLVDDNDLIKVENLSDLQVGYVLASSKVTRRFMPHVYMSISARELRELSYQRGGLYLLQNYLRIYNKDLAAEFGVSKDSFDHEYNWTSDDIDACLKSSDINKLLDALDFAPQGIVDTIKQRAIDMEIPDKRKLEAIGKRTNCDMESIIRNKHAYDNADSESEEEKTPKRRRSETTPTVRRRRSA